MTALPNWAQNARRPSMLITWFRDGTTTPEPMTDATITALIQHGATTTAATGIFTVTDGPNGVFRWDLSAADVANAGRLTVQFNAAFGTDPTPAKTFKASWYVEEALVVSV